MDAIGSFPSFVQKIKPSSDIETQPTKRNELVKPEVAKRVNELKAAPEQSVRIKAQAVSRSEEPRSEDKGSSTKEVAKENLDIKV